MSVVKKCSILVLVFGGIWSSVKDEKLSVIQLVKEDKIEQRKKLIRERLYIMLSLFHSFLTHF